MSRAIRIALAVAMGMVCSILLAAPAFAQVQTGSILVHVADEQGAVLPGATITIASPALVSGQMTAATDAGGVYRFPSLSPGTYAVKVELNGFQSVTREGVAVLVGQTASVDLALKVASVTEAVTVTGAASRSTRRARTPAST